jgi:hypothetical protein
MERPIEKDPGLCESARRFIRLLFPLAAGAGRAGPWKTFLQTTPAAEYEQEVLRLLWQHGLASFAHLTLKENGLDTLLPHSLQERLLQSYRETARRNAILFREMKKLAALFEEAGIRTVPLKGIGLLHRVYPWIGLRPMRDIDLLIRPEDRRRVGSILAASGYLPEGKPDSRRFNRAFLRPDGNLVVEIHWRPADRYRLPDDHWSRLWDRLNFDETSRCWSLSAPDQFLILCHHLDRHGLFNPLAVHRPGTGDFLVDPLSGTRLIWLVDLWHLMNRPGELSLQELIALAREWRVEAALHCGVALTQAWFRPLPQWRWPPGPVPPAPRGMKMALLSWLQAGAAKNLRGRRTLLARLQKTNPRRQWRPIRLLDLLDRSRPGPPRGAKNRPSGERS